MRLRLLLFAWVALLTSCHLAKVLMSGPSADDGEAIGQLTAKTVSVAYDWITWASLGTNALLATDTVRQRRKVRRHRALAQKAGSDPVTKA